MNEIHKQVIKKSYIQLIENLLLPSVLDNLFQHGVITEADRERIDCEPTTRDQRRIFCNILSCKGTKAFKTFCSVLRETEQTHIAEVLERNYATCEVKAHLSAALVPKLKESDGTCLHFEDIMKCISKVQSEGGITFINKVNPNILQDILTDNFSKVKIGWENTNGDNVKYPFQAIKP